MNQMKEQLQKEFKIWSNKRDDWKGYGEQFTYFFKIKTIYRY